MSATVDAERFSRYLNNAPVLNVPGRTFPVSMNFLEDAIEVSQFTIGDKEDPRRSRFDKKNHIDDWEDDGADDAQDRKSIINKALLSEKYSPKTINTLSRLDEYQIPYELIVTLIETIATSPKYEAYSKAILVFLPGIGEIRKLNDYLLGHPYFGGHGAYGGRKRDNWWILPLHSSISTEEQEATFIVPPAGTRKIVLSTNIAETGVTIPDVTCVIDSGKHKEMRFVSSHRVLRLF